MLVISDFLNLHHCITFMFWYFDSVIQLNLIRCEPGWEPPGCKTPILSNGDCDCLSDKQQDRSFLKNSSWTHPKGYRCEALCKWNKDVGVPRAPYNEWKDNQVWRQLSFYQKDLPKTANNAMTHLKIRLNEFDEGFKKFTYLEGTDLGDVIELGTNSTVFIYIYAFPSSSNSYNSLKSSHFH